MFRRKLRIYSRVDTAKCCLTIILQEKKGMRIVSSNMIHPAQYETELLTRHTLFSEKTSNL